MGLGQSCHKTKYFASASEHNLPQDVVPSPLRTDRGPLGEDKGTTY